MKASEWKKVADGRPRFAGMAFVDDDGNLQIKGDDHPRQAPIGWNLDSVTAVKFGKWLLETFEERKGNKNAST